MESVRVELGDGDYAILLTELKHKTSRLVRQCLRKYLKPSKPILLSDIQNNGQLLNDAELDMKAVDTDETGEIIILNQVTEWSFGVVSQEVLDNIPSSKYQRLSEEVDKLYSPTPLAVKT